MSEIVDRQVEPAVAEHDPALAALLHQLNCDLVVPAEDAVDGLLP